MSYIYPYSDPKWTKATSVIAATSDASHVNVTKDFGGDIHTFQMQEVTNHNKFGSTTVGDIVVEIPDSGWFCVWFNLSDIQSMEG